MFTGIVEERGTVTGVDRRVGGSLAADDPADPGTSRIAVHGPRVCSDTSPGDSIAVDGVCLTVLEVTDATFTADVIGETLRRTTLGARRPGDSVNLERAATLSTRLGGHLVQGHVDGTGRILERRPAAGWESVAVSLPPGLRRYLVEKGSITVDGVALTVVAVDEGSFSVGLIPTTLAVTTLADKQPDDEVNLEVDILAKYVESLLPPPALPGDPTGEAR